MKKSDLLRPEMRCLYYTKTGVVAQDAGTICITNSKNEVINEGRSPTGISI